MFQTKVLYLTSKGTKFVMQHGKAQITQNVSRIKASKPCASLCTQGGHGFRSNRQYINYSFI